MGVLTGGLTGAVALLLLSGCGAKSESDDGVACGTASACGGNIVGTWHIVSSCAGFRAASPMPTASCPEQTRDDSGLILSGTTAFAADSSLTQSISLSGKLVMKQPASCLMGNGAAITCAQVEQDLRSTLSTTGSSSISCVDSAGGCECTLVLDPATKEFQGTYTTTAAGLLTQMANGGIDVSDYCVTGDRLTLTSHLGGTTTTFTR